jgi:type I restriction enzyme S subunit
MRHPAYPEYKESGVQWLGCVPKHWKVWKLSHGFQYTGSGTTPPSDNEAWYDGDIPWVTTSELRESIILDTTKKVSKEAIASFSALKLFPEGSLTIAMYGATIGRLGILGVPATTNQACCVMFGERALNARFMFLWFQAFREQVILLASGGGQPNISQDKIRAIRVACPSFSEQTTIADFLDRETGRIDGLVAKKRRLIELLREKRTALISRTVTHGLPADAAREFGLEPHTRFKDSGIDWLNEVPEGWILKAIKWETQVQRGASPRPIDDPVYFDDDGEYSWVRISDVTSAGMYLKETEQRLSELGNSLSVKLQPGSLFLSIAGTVGKPCITLIKCCIHDGFVYFPKWKGESRYLFYIFASGEPYKGLGKMGTQLNLNTDTVGSIVIGIPSIEEQNAIANYLDRETSKIDQLVEKVEAAIGRLQEYRTALITAAVTGKIDVREVVA